MGRMKKYKFEDFISNTSFIKWVNNPFCSESLFWQQYRKKYPEQEDEINKAGEFIRSLRVVEPNIPVERIEKIWMEVIKNRNKNPRKSWKLIGRIAAVFVFLVVATYSVNLLFERPKVVFEEEIASGMVQLILSNGHIQNVEGDESQISQVDDGTIIANNDTIEKNDGIQKAVLNKLVVPYGKRTDLYLADGTHIYVNSGSQIAFPSEFKGSTREIYLSGEAYCEVFADKKHPFIVHTTGVDIKVTGTRFNIHAYDNETVNQTVLESGIVTLISNKGLVRNKLEIRPGESGSFNKENNTFKVEQVVTDQYTSWIHGYLKVEKRSVDNILNSLSRYYDRTISYDESIKDITFSGKLDLSENIKEVLETIAFASGLKINEINNQFIIEK